MPYGIPWRKGRSGNPRGRPRRHPKAIENKQLLDFVDQLHQMAGLQTEVALMKASLHHQNEMIGSILDVLYDQRSQRRASRAKGKAIIDEVKQQHEQLAANMMTDDELLARYRDGKINDAEFISMARQSPHPEMQKLAREVARRLLDQRRPWPAPSFVPSDLPAPANPWLQPLDALTDGEVAMILATMEKRAVQPPSLRPATELCKLPINTLTGPELAALLPEAQRRVKEASK
jgi:hypothetical protein